MSLSVIFDVPDTVKQGLATGQLERVGGVIRNTSNKEIVGWLREAGSNGSSNPISELIGNSGAVHFSAAAFPLINVGFTAITFAATMQQLRQLSEKLNTLQELIQNEFWKDRDKDFEKALEAARNAFESNAGNADFRLGMASAAILELPKARNIFLDEFDRLAALPTPNRELMEHCLIRAIHAHTTLIKCLALHGELNLARERLHESAGRLRGAIRQLLQRWLAMPAALWFYQEVPLELTQRYVAVQRWLRAPDELSQVSDTAVLWDVLREARSGFWDQQLLQQFDDEFGEGIGGLGQRLTRNPKITRKQKLEQVATSLDYAEVLIELDQRLLGYALELGALRLSYAEWEEQLAPEELAAQGGALVVDTEQLAQVAT